MREYRNILADMTVVLIGNGPSLDKTPLDELAKKYVTFGCNHIYRKPFTPTYYSFADKQMLEFLPLPGNFKPAGLFLRAEACVPGNNPIYPIVFPGFSLDIENYVVFGGSGLYPMMQIALYMGVSRILLVGCDHHYPVAGNGTPGTMFPASSSDPDHFTCADGKGYFIPNKLYCRPSLEAVEVYFKNAESIFRKAGKSIINLTPGTHLDVFEKGNIEEWI